MCYYVDQGASRNDVKMRFNIAVNNTSQYYEGVFVNGFTNPNLPIIKNEDPLNIATDYHWGLIPSWASNADFRNNTLNAKIETIESKPTYRYINDNRCLIICTSYYEWRWLDPKGKRKEKYQIFSQDNDIFCFAGLYDTWRNPADGEIVNTFTMVTTEANQLMQYIHNHKKRMPIMLNQADEHAWLDPQNDIKEFAYPRYDSSIVGFEAA